MKASTFFVICLFAFVAAKGQHSLIGKESVFNSYADEQNPVLSPDGSTLYFIRAHHADNVGRKLDRGDIWFSTYDSASGWSNPKNIGFLLWCTEHWQD